MGGIYIVSPFWTKRSRCPGAQPTAPAPPPYPPFSGPAPWRGLHKAGPSVAPPIPSFSPQPRLLPLSGSSLPPRTFSLKDAPAPSPFLTMCHLPCCS